MENLEKMVCRFDVVFGPKSCRLEKNLLATLRIGPDTIFLSDPIKSETSGPDVQGLDDSVQTGATGNRPNKC